VLGKHELVWRGEVMSRLMAQIERVAASETRVCILGETGTGKELVARTLHHKSQRSSGAFITLNCAAVPAELIESELFGHEKGSFTGASGRHLGKFEQASGGTLFLDEIGDMPLAMQAKLLRVLEEGEVERIGGSGTVKVDVRVLVATHRDLADLTREGKFRQDLFHRIYVFPLTLPALRERRDDMPLLIEYFQKQIAKQNNWKLAEFTKEAVAELQRYSWPGNVRELRNMIERLLLLATNNRVDVETVRMALPASTQGSTGDSVSSDANGPLSERMDRLERSIILRELERQQHHITNTAKTLGLERSHFYKKCQQLGIDLATVRNTQG
jgi:two-component system, NtrC family, nitrogen regulation response regulator NtrX